MAIIWGTNYVVIKSAVAEMDPLAFNAVRMCEASLVMLATMAIMRRRARLRPASADRAARTQRRLPHARQSDARRLAAPRRARPGRPLPVSVLLHRRARPHDCGQQLADHRPHPGARRLMVWSGGHDRIKPLHWAGTLLSFAGHLFRGRPRRTPRRRGCAATPWSSLPSSAGPSIRWPRGR